MTTEEMSETIAISVCDEVIAIKHVINELNVCIDENIGKNTLFVITSDDIEKLQYIAIKSPDNRTYDLTAPELNKSKLSCEWKLSSAKPGVWRISFEKSLCKTIYARVRVLSEAINSNAIRMKVALVENNLNNEIYSEQYWRPVLIVELFKANKALIGAEVIATVDRPDGTQTKFKLQAYSHLYYNYFTDFSHSGTYIVNVLVMANESTFRRALFLGQSIEAFQRQETVDWFIDVSKNQYNMNRSEPITIFETNLINLLNNPKFSNNNLSSYFGSNKTTSSTTDGQSQFEIIKHMYGEPEQSCVRQPIPLPFEAVVNENTIFKPNSGGQLVLSGVSVDKSGLEYINVFDAKIQFKQNLFARTDVIIDSDVGLNTIFSIESEDIDKFSVSITHPKSSRVYNTLNNEFKVFEDLGLKRYELELKYAIPGKWKIGFYPKTTQTTQNILAKVFVKSCSVNKDPLIMKVTLKDSLKTISAPLLKTKIMKGTNIVTKKSIVSTIIYKPNGKQEEYGMALINKSYSICLDFLNKFQQIGKYSVYVTAVSDNITSRLHKFRSVGSFQRHQFVGTFVVEKSANVIMEPLSSTIDSKSLLLLNELLNESNDVSDMDITETNDSDNEFVILTNNLNNKSSIDKKTTEMSEYMNIMNETEDYITVCDQISDIRSGDSYSKLILIDPTIGKNTIFSVESKHITKFSIAIIAPKYSRIYDSSSADIVVVKDERNKRYDYKLNTEFGLWMIRFRSISKDQFEARVVVRSQPVIESPIRMDVELIRSDFNGANDWPSILVVDLHAGAKAIRNAKVTVWVTNLDKTLKYYNNPEKHVLKFNKIIHDGTYNEYFAVFRPFKPCWFKVSVSAQPALTFEDYLSKDEVTGIECKLEWFWREQVVGYFAIDKFGERVECDLSPDWPDFSIGSSDDSDNSSYEMLDLDCFIDMQKQIDITCLDLISPMYPT